ncbi:MAG: S9 family peptidase [Calditrichia bacterium]
MDTRKYCVYSMLLLLLLGTGTLFAQFEKMSVEWIYSDARDNVEAGPRFEWKANNQAIWLDSREDESVRTFKWFNPRRRALNSALNMNNALASLQAVRGKAHDKKSLGWPEMFDAEARSAIYLFDSDVFVLDMVKASFRRLTSTPQEEKAVRFSPDGKKVSYVRDNDLYVYHLDKETEQRLTSNGSETLLNGTLSWVYWEEVFARQDIGYWWSGDSKALTYLETDESAVTKMHYVDFKPVEPRLITQRYPKAGTTNPAVRIGILELENMQTTWIDLSAKTFEYIARVKWLPDNKRISIQTLTRDQQELNLYFVDRKSARATHILQETDEGWVNINDDLYFLEDDKHFLWQSERDGYAHLYRFRMDGTLVNQVTKGDWALRSSSATPFWLRQSVVSIDENAQQVYFTALQKSSIERHMYRVNMDGSNSVRLTKRDGTHRTYFSPDGRYYIDRYSNINTLPSMALYQKSGRLQRTIAEANMAGLAKFNLQYPDLFKIPSTEGFPMPAQLLKPADFDEKKRYPLIVYVYGGPSAPTVFHDWGGNNFYFDQMLLDAGYLVARVDHPSSTAISKILENRLLNLMSGPTEMKDVVAGVKWFKDLPYVDESRVGIWGWSGGGSFTLNALTNTKEFKAGISVAPVSDWKYYDTRWAEFAMKMPQDNQEGYKKTSFVESAKNLHGRLLLVHGTYDDNVHPQNSWAFIDELVKHNLRFEMMFYPMRKHGIADRPARIHLYNTMLEFWQRNL